GGSWIIGRSSASPGPTDHGGSAQASGALADSRVQAAGAGQAPPRGTGDPVAAAEPPKGPAAAHASERLAHHGGANLLPPDVAEVAVVPHERGGPRAVDEVGVQVLGAEVARRAGPEELLLLDVVVHLLLGAYQREVVEAGVAGPGEVQ